MVNGSVPGRLTVTARCHEVDDCLATKTPIRWSYWALLFFNVFDSGSRCGRGAVGRARRLTGPAGERRRGDGVRPVPVPGPVHVGHRSEYGDDLRPLVPVQPGHVRGRAA